MRVRTMEGRTKRATARDGAVEHLEQALEAKDPDETDFHLRQALQMLDVADTDE